MGSREILRLDAQVYIGQGLGCVLVSHWTIVLAGFGAVLGLGQARVLLVLFAVLVYAMHGEGQEAYHDGSGRDVGGLTHMAVWGFGHVAFESG